jgi:fucose 4-O-acetylase-like acetyltransferase
MDFNTNYLPQKQPRNHKDINVMRDHRIDFLRFIGLAMIIFAHVDPPAFLFQLRNFDVPLMVLISGMSFGLSYKTTESYLSYIWKRVKRLILPVWIFLTLYFLFLYLYNAEDKDLQLKTIIGSYNLSGGIGYVWIIRVFFLVALVSPMLYQLNKNIKSHHHFILITTILFIGYEIFRYLSLPYIQGGNKKNISLITHYIIPYSLIFALGLRIPQMKLQQLKNIAYASLAIMITIGGYLFYTDGALVPTQKFKYPPSVYYLSYAMFISTLLWILAPAIEKRLENTKANTFILFIAQNSIWVYLWHIPFIKLIDGHFITRYLMVFIAASIIAYCQVWIATHILIKHTKNEPLKRNLKCLLTG